MTSRSIRAAVPAAAFLLALLAFLTWSPEPRNSSPGPDSLPSSATPRSKAAPLLRFEHFDADRHRGMHPVRKGTPLRFAVREEVALSPVTHGTWETRNGEARWRLRVEAPGARNLNFGIRDFHLPASGRFEMRAPDGTLLVRPFTAADNAPHGQLWTPVVAGESVDLVLTVAADERADLRLEMESINRGFREITLAAGYEKIGSNPPLGNCHIDVVCDATQSGVGAMIDLYQDQIRSAGVYTLGGQDQCSGALVNNTEQDGKPLFLTADHCQVRANNAASMVVYWNFQNSTCRTPGTTANGQDGNGPLTQFNSGAFFRATYAPSDFTLVEMDSPIPTGVNPFFAGWSRSTATPASAVGIHHPNISEKRISFEFDSLQSTTDGGTTTNPSGTHWRIIDWDHGSTEGGSSGSPIFDENGRLVGQLTGGFAACGNNSADWYGKFVVGWDGGGSATTRMRDWLDPQGTNPTTLDGTNGQVVVVDIADAVLLEGDSGTSLMQFTVTRSESTTQPLTVTFTTQNGSALSGTDFAAAAGQSVVIPANQTTATAEVAINGDTDPEENETFTVNIALPGSPPAMIGDGSATGTITNDDFVIPVVTGPSSVNGLVGVDVAATVTADNTPTSFALSGEPAGMTIDGSGLISWVPTASGAFTAMVTATNAAGTSAPFEISFAVAAPLEDAVEADGPMLALSTGGSTDWTREASGDVLAGGDRAASGLVGDNQESWLETTVEGADYLGFWWKVSSEQDYDFLQVEVNGVVRERISGTRGWEYLVLALPPGTNTVRWVYAKDESEFVGSDRGWVDFVQRASKSRPFLMEPPILYAASGVPVDYGYPTATGEATVTPGALGGGLAVDAAGEVTGTPAGGPPTAFNLTLNEDGNSITMPAEIRTGAAVPAGPAVEQPGVPWLATGSGTWTPSAVSNGDGDSIAESGVLDSQSASLTTVVYGPGSYSFQWKVDSEDGFDGMIFTVDGEFVDSISGDVDWTPISGDLNFGPHVLTWTYSKDVNTAAGADTGWIDEFVLDGYAGWVAGEGLGARANPVLDREGDGLNLFWEFASGGTAAGHDLFPFPVLAGGLLEWTLMKSPDVRDAYFDAEVTDALFDWKTSERTVVQDDATLFKARDTIGTSTAAKRFIRGEVGPAR